MKEVLRCSKGVTIFRRQYLGYKVKGEYGDGDCRQITAQGKEEFMNELQQEYSQKLLKWRDELN